METKLYCKTCSAEAVMLCCCDTARSKFCKVCLPDHLISATEKAHTVLPLQAYPFIQTKKEEKRFFDKMNILNELIGRVNSRLERLLFVKEQAILEIQLAAEELKRLVDKELEQKIDEIKALNTKKEYELKALRNAMEEMRYEESYDKTSLAGRIYESKELAEQLLLEPFEFQLFTEPFMELLPKMVYFYYRDVRAVNSKLVIVSDEKQKASLVVPAHNTSTQKSSSFKLKRVMGCCCLPDGSLFFAGGRVDNKSSKEAAISDPGMEVISNIEDMHCAKDSMALIYYENSVYSFGGWQAESMTPIKENEKFDLKANEWVNICNFEEGLFNLTGICHQDLFYLAGCGSRTFYRYDPNYDSFVRLNVTLPINGPVRLLPSIDESIIALQYDKLIVVKVENEAIVKEIQIPTKDWWGTCAPVVFDKKVYFLENSDIWVYDYSSVKIEKYTINS